MASKHGGAEREAARRRREAERRAPAPDQTGAPADGLSARSLAARIRGGNNRWDALDTLREAYRQERSAEARRHRAVLRAREVGASWVDIARILGISPQAVQQRYGAPSTSGRS